MDAYEATRIVFSRIQTIDPDNASKIMGLLLIQDHGEKEMIRLAFGPEALVHSVILKARKDLGLSPSTPSTPSSPSPFFSNHHPISLSRQNSNSRLMSNLSPSSSSWAPPPPPPPPSTYSHLDDLINSSSPNLTSSNTSNTCSSASYAAVVAAAAMNDEFQLQDQLSFLADAATGALGPNNSDSFYPPPSPTIDPSTSPDAMLFPPYWGNGNHRRSCSVSDICMASSDPLGSSLGWKPCLYFARGYCKNGTSCRFLHGLPDSPDSNSMVGSPSKLDFMEQCQELLLLRSKTQQQQQQQQQQQLRSQLMASSTFPYSPTSANSKCMNFLLQQQQNDTQRAALMLGEDAHKFSSRSRIERNEFLNSLGGGGMMMNPGSRQIYLTFPADSTFREEDVSNYFSIYGPVQDVRIPYQQKRMFGFVTFVYPETVKLILAKGNPHFVCDARVLVKPYKEKGKVPDKKQQQQQQQMERGEFSVCTTPTGLDSRDPYDLQLGGRMFNSTQDVLLRRKLEEQVELQQAIELQSRRFMGLQLLDVKKHQHHHQRNLSSPSPTHPFSPHINHTPFHPSSSSDRSSPESNEDCLNPAIADKQGVAKEDFNHDDYGNGGNSNSKESPKNDGSDFHTGLEHNLPDSPFASPTKSGGDPSFFSTAMAVASAPSVSLSSSINNNNLISSSSLLPATSTLDMASYNSRFLQIPRFSSNHGAIGM
ncbi:Zinc finger ccch domain-containing protein [Thalictrum thalictroides]|uniref:Zinc finger ccch domain-containing protein n=1 Tax=Thalictrum thalictroides TaxID=46969 RepID=A0A7J6V2N3_THATH|nr:Zinc finger ccch domain-containing protein [Thalictrum thalictroides]